MANWLRNLVAITVTGVWATVVLTSLWRGILPDAFTWSVPGAIWLALSPAKRRGTTAPAPREPAE